MTTLGKKAPFDVYPLRSTNLSDIDTFYFERKYLTQAFAPDVLEANDRSIEEQLAATKMIHSPDDTTPTVLGMLVLGNDPQWFLPGAYVQFLAGNPPAEFHADARHVRVVIRALPGWTS